MRLCFLFYQAFDEIAKVMIASVRKHMPNAIITQLSDMKTRRIPEVDEIRRIDGSTHGFLQAQHMMSCPLPFIRIDYDMILQGDLTHILDGDHEMAFNLHGDPNVTCTDYGKRYPIAASVYGAKTHDFAKALRRAQIDSGLDDWLGAAHTHNEVAKRFHVKLLDGRIYNYTPKNRDDKPDDVLVLHYKGMRKHWMVPPEMASRAKIDEQKIAAKVREYKETESLVRGA